MRRKIELDIMTLVLIAGIVISFTLILIGYYMYEIDSCTKDPLVYGANMYKELYNAEEFNGMGFLILDTTTISPTFTFNSNNLSIN